MKFIFEFIAFLKARRRREVDLFAPLLSKKRMKNMRKK